MAPHNDGITLGIDVSKRSLEVAGRDGAGIRVIPNSPTAIEEFLNTLPAPVALAVEATNTFHEQLVERAVARGFQVYLVDGYKVNTYREAVGVRAKTDASDAHLLHRYLVAERSQLRAVSWHNRAERQLWRLLKRRAKLVKVRSQMTMSLRDLDLPVPEVHEALTSLNRLIARLTTLAHGLAQQCGWSESLAQLRTIPGVGELSAFALKAMYNRGEFRNVNCFIAFLGLDIRVRDSGTYRGRRKLTKKGDPEVRRLLFNGARNAAYRQPEWSNHKQQLMARGFSEIQTSVILARKIARIGYALLKTGNTYEKPITTCASS